MASFFPIALLALLTSLVPPSYAWPPTFGPEWTFFVLSGSKPVGGSYVQKAQLKLVRRFNKLCKTVGCTIETVPGNFVPDYRITYPDGYYLVIGIDNGVVEVQAKPTTAQEFSNIKDRVQRDVFDAMKTLGYAPHHEAGGGHIHIGKDSAFGNDALLFRNFLVDQFNHRDLLDTYLGGNDYWTRMNKLNPAQKVEFEEVIREFDEGKIQGIEDLAKAITERVYIAFPKGTTSPDRDQAVNLLRMYQLAEKSARTSELRNIRPQENAEEFSALCDLLDARLTYLKSLNAPLAITMAPQKATPLLWAKYIHSGGYGPQLKRYARFVSDPYQRALCEEIFFESDDVTTVEELIKLEKSYDIYPAELSAKIAKVLLRLQDHPSSGVRFDVRPKIDQLQEADAFLVIRRGLESKYIDTRTASTQLLGTIKSDEAIPLIRDILQKPNSVLFRSLLKGIFSEPRGMQQMRAFAVDALKGRSNLQALELLQAAARDGNPVVRDRANRILREDWEGSADAKQNDSAKRGPRSAHCLQQALHRLLWQVEKTHAQTHIKGMLALSAMVGGSAATVGSILYLEKQGKEAALNDGKRLAHQALSMDSPLRTEKAYALSFYILNAMPEAACGYLVREWKKESNHLSKEKDKWRRSNLDKALASEQSARSYWSHDPDGAANILGEMLKARWERGSGDRAAQNVGEWTKSILLEEKPQK